MRNAGTIAAAVFVAAVLILYMCTFQVRFTEVAIVKTLGRPAPEPITEPGLKWKWPRPVQTAVVYDKRLRIMEDRTEQTRTVDGKTVLLTTYTIWRITDPAKFHTNFPGGEEDGERKLRATVVTHKHAVTGRRGFNEFVSTDPTTRQIHQIEDEIRRAVAADVEEEFGIEVVSLGVKKLGLPEAVTTEIFASMRSAEERKAARYHAEGNAHAQAVLANANAMRDRILAEVDRKVAEIRNEADTLVSAYYKEFDEYPYLRIFLDSLRTLREGLRERSTLILSDEEMPWGVFNPAFRARFPEMDGLMGAASVAPGGGKPARAEAAKD